MFVIWFHPTVILQSAVVRRTRAGIQPCALNPSTGPSPEPEPAPGLVVP